MMGHHVLYTILYMFFIFYVVQDLFQPVALQLIDDLAERRRPGTNQSTEITTVYSGRGKQID